MKITNLALSAIATLALGTSAQAFESGTYECKGVMPMTIVLKASGHTKINALGITQRGFWTDSEDEAILFDANLNEEDASVLTDNGDQTFAFVSYDAHNAGMQSALGLTTTCVKKGSGKVLEDKPKSGWNKSVGAALGTIQKITEAQKMVLSGPDSTEAEIQSAQDQAFGETSEPTQSGTSVRDTGLKLVDGLITLSSSKSSCQVKINGNKVRTNSCKVSTNSKNVEIVCLKDKSMCKTSSELVEYYNAYNVAKNAPVAPKASTQSSDDKIAELEKQLEIAKMEAELAALKAK